jgi:hypothetical protein
MNTDRSSSRSATYIRHLPSCDSANSARNGPSQASRRPTTAPPGTTDRYRPPSNRAYWTGIGGDDSSCADWPLQTLLSHCARSPRHAQMSRLQRIVADQTCPSPSTLNSLRCPSPVLPSPFTPPFTPPAITHHSASLPPSLPNSSLPLSTLPPSALRSAALHPSLHHPSLMPVTSQPSPLSLPLFTPRSPPDTPALHCAHFHPSFRRASPFTPAPANPALHRSSRRSSPLTPPCFTPALHSATHHSSPPLRRPSLITPSPALHSATLHPHASFWHTDNLPSLSFSSSNCA